MAAARARRVPEVLRGRPPCDREDFVGRHFPSGELRDAARRLWRVLEEDLGIELSGLHPSDDLRSLLHDPHIDSLEMVELIMIAEEELPSKVLAGEDWRLGSFRECVERLARGRAKKPDGARGTDPRCG